ncbi:MAG: endolytic transglycosylase MltG, partial [Thermacetogeniaceae bacterium]
MRLRREKLGIVGYLFLNPVLLGIILMLVGSLWIGGRVFFALLSSPANSSPTPETFMTVKIEKGASLHEVADLLQQKGLIRSARFFVWYARCNGEEKKIKAGSYRISSAWGISRILDVITEGKVISYRVTVPEGYTTEQIAHLLASKGIVSESDFMAAVSSAEFDFPFLKGCSPGPKRLEGYLFPATYEFQAGMSGREVVEQMLKAFQKAFSPELQRRAVQMGLTVREVVILASIVEREAKLDRERPLVAAVFLNRLKHGMRLESCATVQYVLGKQKERLTYDDLRIPSPYNTYLHDGLPPGPISNPGLASIKAVLYPAKVDYLYFVARGDGS